MSLDEKPAVGPSDDAGSGLYDDLLNFMPTTEEIARPPTPDEVKPVANGRPRASSSPKVGRGRKSAADSPDEEDEKVQLIFDLPVATKNALKTFIRLDENTYQNKSLGTAKQQEESMVCECSYDAASDDLDEACGPRSNCINRDLFYECLPGDCRCRTHCQNQRLQKREYAPIEIVQTAQKGFGVRAGADLAENRLIYEYIGEVIGHSTFERKIAQYFDEGIEHFYFMSLGRDEYIDATKKGNLGRFLNHSCRPNCKVEKWTVGKKLRMGIFAKRNIQAGEELTFNYNVDRYGHEAQVCHCGESNCVGFIGGNTQTDLVGMDELFMHALGIYDEVVTLGLKGNKKRKSKKLDVDFLPTLKPITRPEVQKVSAGLKQATGNVKVLSKIMSRIRMTEDVDVQREIMRRHGFSLISTIINEYSSDLMILALALEVLLGWPLITRNKLQTTGIEPLIVSIAEREDDGIEPIKALAKQLVASWLQLEIGYRIPKAVRDAIDVDRKRAPDLDFGALFKRQRIDAPRNDDSAQRSTYVPRQAAPEPLEPLVPSAKKEVATPAVLPPNWRSHKTPDGKTYYSHIQTRQVVWDAPTEETSAKLVAEWKAAQDVGDIVSQARKAAEKAAAKQKAEADAIVAAEEAEKQRRADERRAERRAKKDKERKRKEHEKRKAAKEKAKSRPKSAPSSAAKSKPPDKDKAMLRLFSTIVVSTMSRYKTHFEPDKFKQRAKEATQICCDKERKSKHYAIESYKTISSKKESQIRDFVKSFVGKLLIRKGVDISALPSSSKARNGVNHPTGTPLSTPPVASTSGVSGTPAEDDIVSPAFEPIDVADQSLLAELNGDDEPEPQAGADEDGDVDMVVSDDASSASDDEADTKPSAAAAASVVVADPTLAQLPDCSAGPSPPTPPPPTGTPPPDAKTAMPAVESGVTILVDESAHDIYGDL